MFNIFEEKGNILIEKKVFIFYTLLLSRIKLYIFIIVFLLWLIYISF